uniref:Cytochrome c oxidase polypeptide VIIc n=1 Tax=Plectus sambesii TaxID=2011161 RepID=A0A914V527_9BILA
MLSATQRLVMARSFATTALRRAHDHAHVIRAHVGQTPSGPVHDGWAGATMPFNVKNKWGFYFRSLIFCVSGFWPPFAIVHYQLHKANAGQK